MGKYVVGLLGMLALGWILYVGVNIASSGPSLEPGTVFHRSENTIIVHKPEEVDNTEPGFSILVENTMYASLLSHTERVQHFYFSATGNVALLERSKPWTIELADRYFQKLALRTTFTSAREMALSNGWSARFDKEYLLVFKQDPQLSDEAAVNWKYIDRKSTASLIQWKNGNAFIENVYRKADGVITYISNGNSDGKHLADDQDLFLDVIPEAFSDYRFYEKNYLHTLDPAASPAYDWINNGVAVVNHNGKPCIITDYITGQDPIAILGDAVDESSIREGKNSGFVRNSSLPKPLPIGRDWHIEVFNSRVFIAEDQKTIDAFIGAYEAGRTLSQNIEKYAGLFYNVPQKVSYRHLSAEEHRTISLLEGSRHTVVRKYTEPATDDEVEKPKVQQAEPIRIEGGIAHLLPVQGSDFLFVVSRNNTVYGINKQSERWKKPLENSSEVALSTTGNELIVTTANSVHVLNQQGNELEGFPLQHPGGNVMAACYYTWKGQNRLALADKNFLTIYSAGKKVNSIRLPFAPREKASLIVWVNRGELTATITGETKAMNISIDRKRQGKSFSIPSSELTAVKTGDGPHYFGIENNTLVMIAANGDRRELAAGAKRIAGTTNDFGKAVIAVQTGKNVRLFSESGNQLGTVSPTFTDIESVSCLGKASGKMIVGILDGLSNNNYIYTLNGKQLTTDSFEGATLIVLHRQKNGSLLLLSQSNGYLVRYPVE